MNRPIVGITMGDPAGNGPEITVKALAHADIYDRCRPIVVGDAKMLEQAKGFVGRPDIQIHRCEKVSDALFTPGTIDVLHMELIPDVSRFELGKVSVEGGNAAFQCVKKVIELAMAGEVDATCTNALNKEAMNKALEADGGAHSDGYTHFDGHTEIYATYTHTKKYTMMLAHHDLRVVHVSTHCSLREACDRVKKARVLEVIEIANQACKDMGIAEPKVAVAGLNPHCGENGLFGTEEIEEIKPAIEGGQGRRDQRHRAHPARQRVQRGAGRLVRHRGLYVPRPGAHPPQDSGLRVRPRKAGVEGCGGRQCDVGPAHHPHQCGPRHRLCPGGQGHQQRAEPGQRHRLRRADGQRTQKSINTACLAVRFRGGAEGSALFAFIAKRNGCSAGKGRLCVCQSEPKRSEMERKRTSCRKCFKKRQNAKGKFEQFLILFPAETDFPAWPIEANRRFGYNLDTKIKPNCAGCRNLHMRKRV